MNIKPLIEAFSAAVAPITTIITVYIAYQQYQTARYKLRQDLYEKRFKVFRSLMELLSHVVQKADVSPKEITQFRIDTSESVFLFDKDIPDYLEIVANNAVKLFAINQKLHHSDLPVGQDRSRLAQENADLLEWLSDQANVSQKKFAKYLRLKA